MLPLATRLAHAVRSSGTALCVGIDPHPELVGDTTAAGALAFGRDVLAACPGRVAMVKPQFAFFEALGLDGMAALATLLHEARDMGLLVIGDAKRGDIGTTAAAYARATLADDAPFPCDALTVSPFLGPESLAPFLDAADRHGRGVFVLLRTSNPGSDAFQLPVVDQLAAWIDGASAARADASGLGPVGAVVGATLPAEIARLRAAMPHTWLLVPGYGAQGAGAENVRAAYRPDGLGVVVPTARAATPPFPAGTGGSRADWYARHIDLLRADLARGVGQVTPG